MLRVGESIILSGSVLHNRRHATPLIVVSPLRRSSTPHTMTSQDSAEFVRADEKKDSLKQQDGGVQVPIYNDVEAVSSEDLSFNAILRGTAAKPMNTFEKKAALINVEIDKFGLGKYQICIWFLCGFGYFLDLAWSQGVGLVSTAIYQEMGVPDGQTGTIFTAANAGLAIGALGFGLAVDIIGRKWAFNLTCLITSVFGLILVSIKYEQTYDHENSNGLFRLPPNTTMLPSAEFISLPLLVLEAISPSMPLSPLNSCLRNAATSSPFFLCGSRSVSFLRPQWPWVPLPSGVVSPSCYLAKLSHLESHAAGLMTTWDGVTTLSSLEL